MIRRGMRILLVILFAIIAFVNLRLYGDSDTEDAVAQLHFLRIARSGSRRKDARALSGGLFFHACPLRRRPGLKLAERSLRIRRTDLRPARKPGGHWSNSNRRRVGSRFLIPSSPPTASSSPAGPTGCAAVFYRFIRTTNAPRTSSASSRKTPRGWRTRFPRATRRFCNPTPAESGRWTAWSPWPRYGCTIIWAEPVSRRHEHAGSPRYGLGLIRRPA